MVANSTRPLTEAGGAKDPRPLGDARRSTARVLLSGASWNAVAQFAPIVINIVMTPYVIRHLGVDRWGLIALVTTIESIVTSFDGGLTASTNRYFAVYAGRDDRVRTTRTLTTVLAFIFAVGLLLSIPGWFVTPGLVDLFSMPKSLRPETVFYLRAVVALIALGFARNTIAAVVTARQRFAALSLRGLSTYVVWIVGLYITVVTGSGLRGVAVTFLTQQAVATIIVVPLAVRYLDLSAVRLLPWDDARQLLAYSSRVQVAGLSRLANAELDSIVIGTVLSIHGLAMYSAGAGLASQVSGVFINAVTPAGTQLGQIYGADGEAGARASYLQIQRWWVLACNACFAVALGGAYYAIVDWLGPSFAVGGVIAMMMVAGQGILALATMLGVYCITIGRADIELRVGVLAMTVNVVLTVPLLLLGAEGVAAATVIGWAFGAWYLLRLARKSVNPDLPSYTQGLSVAATAVTVPVVFFLEYLVHPLLPVGALGLVGSVGPDLVGLTLFLLLRVGPKKLLGLLARVGRPGSAGVRTWALQLASGLAISLDQPADASNPG